jgi:hypothetical protein
VRTRNKHTLYSTGRYCWKQLDFYFQTNTLIPSLLPTSYKYPPFISPCVNNSSLLLIKLTHSHQQYIDQLKFSQRKRERREYNKMASMKAHALLFAYTLLALLLHPCLCQATSVSGVSSTGKFDGQYHIIYIFFQIILFWLLD